MTPDELMELLSAKVDGELSTEQQEKLEQHLKENPDDRVLLEAFQLQDVQLRNGFEPQRQQASMVAAQVAQQLPLVAPEQQKKKRISRGTWLVFATAASLFGVLLWWQIAPKSQPIQVVEKNPLLSPLEDAMLRPKPLIRTKESEVVLGPKVETAPGERRRVRLEDGSTLFLNENSKVTLSGRRQIQLDAGEIYLSAIPATEVPDQSKFIVTANGQKLTALGTKFAVRLDEAKPTLLVTQGKVQVDDRTSVLAGQRYDLASKSIDASQRASVALDWTRELLIESDTPLVPGSKFSGGSLVAVDPYGQEAKLSLVKYHVDVYIEDGFARTTIDQTYFNHENFQMEGTFYFPLPPDASLSRLAMYVNGVLMEGGMAEREHARRTYETIRHSMRDPALLEWVDGSMFKMRVFPLEARQEKRILLSYTQKLPVAYGRSSYRFPAGHSLNLVDRWSFEAFVKGGEKLRWHSPSNPKMKRDEAIKEGLRLTDAIPNARLDQDVTLELIDDNIAPAQDEMLSFSSTEHDGQRYLMMRYQPVLLSEPRRERRDWVFLFESSGARDPLLARTQVEIIRSLLLQAEHDDTFNVITVGTRVNPWQKQNQTVTLANVDSAVQFLEGSHLIGATDLQAGLQTAMGLLKGSKNPYLVHLGSGLPSLGECRAERLVALIDRGVKYIGVAVGKRFSPQLLKVAAEQTGGYFTQINPDESIAWRSFELFSTLNAARLLNLTVEVNGTAKMLPFSNSIIQGEAFTCVCKLPVEPSQDPTQAKVKGLLNGVPFEKVLKIEKISTLATYLPRMWAKLEIDRLLADDAANHKNRIIELSKQMYVMSPFTSLLVLENEQMYRDFKVDRGRKDHWAMYAAPAKIPVVYIPDASRPLDRNAPQLENQKPHENQVIASVLVRSKHSFLTKPQQPEAVSTERGGRHPGRLGEANLSVLDAEFKERITSAPMSPREMQQILGGNLNGRSASTRTRLLRMYGGNNRFDGIADRSMPLGDLERDEIEFTTNMPAQSELGKRRSRLSGRGLGRSDRDAWDETAAFGADPMAREMYYIPQSMISDQGKNYFHLFSRGGDRDGDREGLLADSNKEFAVDDYRFVRPELAISAPLEPDGEVRRKKSQLDRQQVQRLALGMIHPPAEYQRLRFTREERLFTDLVSYAPGLSSLSADVKAAVDSEAAPRFGSRRGQIDPDARKLIDSARSAQWVETTIMIDDRLSVTLQHDGQGRFRYRRELPLGLVEEVASDGKELLHLYPEIGLGGRRILSRFHRADWYALMPDLLPPVEDLAHGTDVRLHDAKTVALRPLGVRPENQKHKWIEIRLCVEAGRLTEKQTVLMPEGKVYSRLTFDAQGARTQFDRDGKEIDKIKQTRKNLAQAPALPETKELVVLPMPLRSREMVYRELHLDPNHSLYEAPNPCFEFMTEEEVLRLIACDFAQSNGSHVEHLWRTRFLKQGDRRIGFLVLLLAIDSSPNFSPLLKQLSQERPNDSLVRYLLQSEALRNGNSNRQLQEAYGYRTPRDLIESPKFLDRLMTFNALRIRWDGGWIQHQTYGYHTWEIEDAFRFVKANASNELGWGFLDLLGDQMNQHPLQKRIAETWKLLGEQTQLNYRAGYEEARAWYRANESVKARERFESLFVEQLKAGILPAVDSTFRYALQEDQVGESWPKLMKQTAQLCIERKLRPVVVQLAWKSRQVGDLPLAATLFEMALNGSTDPAETLETKLSAIEYLISMQEFAPADEICRGLLKESDFAKNPQLWRLAAQLATNRGERIREIECLETALDLEFAELPEVVDLQSLRNDYSRLFNHYEYLVQAATDLKVQLPSDLASRTVRAADRWRSLDPESDSICSRAASILRSLKNEEAKSLAWDYLTTPLAQKPNESGPWLSLAEALIRQHDSRLADDCFAQAMLADPGDAEIVWKRVQHLKRYGEEERAKQLLRQLADGDWQPRFQWLKTQARQTLEGR
jgi:ferric-dicitrate binding protein FerR (iron transport regulator)